MSYYVSYTPEAAEEARQFSELREMGSAGPFYVFEAPPTELVEVARFQPSVYREAPGGNPISSTSLWRGTTPSTCLTYGWWRIPRPEPTGCRCPNPRNCARFPWLTMPDQSGTSTWRIIASPSRPRLSGCRTW